VRRAKGGEAATHPLLGDELRALRELKRQAASPFVFASERGGPFTPSGFAKLLARAGDELQGSIPTCSGIALANKGIDTRTLQAYLGHRSMNSTTRVLGRVAIRGYSIYQRPHKPQRIEIAGEFLACAYLASLHCHLIEIKSGLLGADTSKL
jgi:integrase